jgi:2-polyprenyl-3-methyl-5-hydroxy-6-metoxy-1,4-benzoquinol methylase
MFLMQFYAASGHGNGTRKTLKIVTDTEIRNPNSTLDAERMTSKILYILEHRKVSGRRFLDVASGYGFFSMKAIEKGFEVRALEIAETEREITEEMTGLKPVAVSFEEYVDKPGSYSAILMSQILEHALDVNAWIAKASALLMTGGVLSVALPNFDSVLRILLREQDPYICPPAHLNFFTKNSLVKLLKKHGLVMVSSNYVSRISADVIQKRIPRILGKMLPISSTLKIADMFGIGIMINMYAVKR